MEGLQTTPPPPLPPPGQKKNNKINKVVSTQIFLIGGGIEMHTGQVFSKHVVMSSENVLLKKPYNFLIISVTHFYKTTMLSFIETI